MWELVLCVMVAGWGGAEEVEHDMNNITRITLLTMAEQTNMEVTTYPTLKEFDTRLLAPIYGPGNLMVKAVSKEDAYPEGIMSVARNKWTVAPLHAESNKLLVHYAGPAAIIVVLLILILVSVVACIYWCRYWLNVKKRQPSGGRHDDVYVDLLAKALAVLVVLFMLGVLCALVTHSSLEDGSAEAGEQLRAGLRYTQTYFNATKETARWLLVDNYNKLEASLNTVINSFGLRASLSVPGLARAAAVTSLHNMVQSLDDVQADLRALRGLSAALRHKAAELNTELPKVKSQLLQALAKCNHTKCFALRNKLNIKQLDTEIQYRQMPEVSDLLNNVTALLDSNIKDEVAEGQKAFRNFQHGIQSSVELIIPDVKDQLQHTGLQLMQLANKIVKMTQNACAKLEEMMAEADKVQKLHTEYGPYRRYAGLTAAIALLVVGCLFVWGVMCEKCDLCAEMFGATCCFNESVGFRVLLCGTGLMLLMGGVVILVLLIHFIFGFAMKRFVCDPLIEPRGNRLFADLEKFVDFENFVFQGYHSDPTFNMTSVLVDCHKNMTIYKVLRLSRVLQLEKLLAAERRALQQAAARLQPAMPALRHHVTLLSAGARDRLRQLADTGLSDLDFGMIFTALKTNITSLDLGSLAKQLNSSARSLQRPRFVREAVSLIRASLALSAVNNKVLKPMLAYSAQLNKTATKLRNGLRFGYGFDTSTFKDSIKDLSMDAKVAENYINSLPVNLLQDKLTEFVESLSVKHEKYINVVRQAALSELGRCGPLSAAFNTTRDIACKKILYSANGYWFSLLWCLLLAIPLILVAQRLALLYYVLKDACCPMCLGALVQPIDPDECRAPCSHN